MLEQQKNRKCKVVLVGESNTGKTCIINQFVKGKFNETTATIGTPLYHKKISCQNEETVKLIIWDTSGQEKYRAINKIYYKDAKIVILVYDITDRKSFIEIKEYWVNEIKNLGDRDAILGLAGNKIDLYSQATVTEKEGKAFADSINAIFHQTSAFKNIGIDELYQELAEKYVALKKERDELEDIKLSLKEEKKEGGCCSSSEKKHKRDLRSTEVSTKDNSIL